MKKRKISTWCVHLAISLVSGVCLAQTISESAQPLSKEAQKGYIDDVKFDNDGKIHVIYQNKIDKKGSQIAYEDYVFDKGLKFVEKKITTVDKEIKPDKEVKRLGAYVGACSSFDVNSMKLRVSTDKVKLSDWNYKKQRYDKSKVIDSETVKLKSENGKAYFDIEKYWTDDAAFLVVLAYYETKDKSNPKKYVLLTIDFDGNVKERALDVSGNYSLVYSQELSEEQSGKSVGKQDIIVILAPKQTSSNIFEYVYLHYDIQGNLKNKVVFQSPSSNLLVTNATIIDGSVFLFGQSKNVKVAFEKVFEDYAPLPNPCYIDDENYQMYKYNKAANDEMDNFHVLKINGGKLEFATTSDVAGIKDKMKTPPSDKGATPYKGKKFSIARFEVTPNNEFLIAGQLVSKVNIGSLKQPFFVRAYGDIVCLHLDAKGNLKAQYAVDKMFETKKSKLWEMPMSFYFATDGKSVYWEILEIKGERDFWTGYITMPELYPRIAKIDLENTSIGDFKVFGQKKYFVYKSFPGTFLPEQNCLVYFGKDEGESVLWVGKAAFF